MAQRGQRSSRRQSPSNAFDHCRSTLKKLLTNPRTSGKINESSGNGCEQNLGVFPSGQWGQTVNLLLFSFGGSNPPAPTKQEKSEPVSDWRRVRIFRFLRVQQRRFLWTTQNVYNAETQMDLTSMLIFMQNIVLY